MKRITYSDDFALPEMVEFGVNVLFFNHRLPNKDQEKKISAG